MQLFVGLWFEEQEQMSMGMQDAGKAFNMERDNLDLVRCWHLTVRMACSITRTLSMGEQQPSLLHL